MEEEIVDLPDTQTQECVDNLTQPSQEAVTPWGRLSALTPFLPSADLYEQCYIIGRDKGQCNIIIQNPHLNYFNNISKVHFKITEENHIIYLTDLSKNGTFVNSKKVGRNRKNIIHSGDVIALGHPKDRVYIFGSNIHDSLNLPQQIRKKYFVSRLLGAGAAGEVRFALDKSTCQEYAIKKIIKGSSTARLNHPEKIKTEIEILKKLSHPFIIHMTDAYETENEVFLVLEYMKGGVLSQRILSVIPLPEAEVKFIFCQMALAVQYLHRCGITHRDLKPENVLLASDDAYPLIKISDFGLSKIMEERSMMETLCGTINYAAPEIVSHSERYSNKVDVWSLGVILFYMCCKELPFQADERPQVVKNILSANIQFSDPRWRNSSWESRELVKKMLTVNPARRIGIDEVIKHAWMRQDSNLQYKIKRLLREQTCDRYNDSDLSDSSEDVCAVIPPKRLHLSV